uniref:Exostosin GT47 domain-containing protein n=1 Tax=viral metagenome TaxID=1070528 RepID=A0A6C0HMT4_9ZZZZ
MEKIKVGFFSSISSEWFHLHKDRFEQIGDIAVAKYLIYESSGDPIDVINKIKSQFPKEKLVFILSGDKNEHIDDECIWFTNAVKPSGLAKRQTQIFVTNPAIFKFYRQINNRVTNITPITERAVNIYFKGTIWPGMRTEMANFFKDKVGCNIVANNNYWDWRFSIKKPSNEQIEQTAFESYNDMLGVKLVLCPKGNGNSSMRIIESIVCGAIPILIDDISAPFENDWSNIALVFNSKENNCKYTGYTMWDNIWDECNKLLNDNDRMIKMQNAGIQYFKDVVYSDYTKLGCEMYKDLGTVCYGFSGKIMEYLIKLDDTITIS